MKILLVDDSEDTLEALSLLFSSRGYKTFIATTRDETLSLARSESPEVVILDLGLPDKSIGLDICRLLKRNIDAVIIVYSGWAQPRDRAAALAAGADWFFPKPTDFSEMEVAITQGLTPCVATG